MHTKVTAKRLSTPRKIPDLYPDCFTSSGIRWVIFNSEKNGFSRCIRRLGRKILIDLDQFEAWIDEQKGGLK